MIIETENPKYRVVTFNSATTTTRKSRTYFINIAINPNLPPINNMREGQLTCIADYVTEGNNLIKCRGDINEILIKGLLCDNSTTKPESNVEDTLLNSKPLVCPVSTQKNLIKLRDEILMKESKSNNISNLIVQLRLKINSCLYRE